MKKEVIIAFDIGTSNIKTAAINVADGEMVALESQPYPLLKTEEEHFEIDPHTLWGSVQTAFGRLFQKTKDDCRYLGISFSWFADCIVLMDENLKPLTNIVQYADSRAAGATMEYFMQKDPLARCKEKGLPPISMFLAPRSVPLKLMWFRQNQPEVYARARYVFDNQQFILSCLGLEPACDDSLAAAKRLEDVRKREWSRDLMEIYEFPPELCKERIVSCTEVVGTVDHIGEIKLPEAVPVIIGAHDEICGMLGVGALPDQPGTIANMMGTSDTVTYFADYSDGRFPETGILPVRTKFGTYNVGGHGLTMTGAAFAWFTEQFFPNEGVNALTRLFQEAKFDASNPLLMVPMFGRSKVGMRDLSLGTTPLHIFTALAEGIAYELAYNLADNDQQMFKETGSHINRVIASGGASRSDAFLQLRASVFGLPIQRSATTQACCMGAALMAATSLGVYSGFREAADHMIHLGEVFMPDERQRDAYLAKEPQYRAFHDVIAGPARKH